MNEYDVAILLITYSEKCAKAYSRKQLQNIVRELKKRLDSDTIKKLHISDENTFILTSKA